MGTWVSRQEGCRPNLRDRLLSSIHTSISILQILVSELMLVVSTGVMYAIGINVARSSES
jgi:hypothetical protein